MSPGPNGRYQTITPMSNHFDMGDLAKVKSFWWKEEAWDGKLQVVQENKAMKIEIRKEGTDLEVGVQIKNYRSRMGISQEELAEKVYVSRQTVSNWETGKNYPDIHSVLLLSSVFNVSLDQLMKGDVEIMKKEIQKTEIEKLNKYGGIYAVCLILSIISFIPFIKLMDWYGLIPWSGIYGAAVCLAFKVSKIKKDNQIATYKEIVAFTEGKRLDDMEQQQEIGKRPYQAAAYMLASAGIAFAVVYLMARVFHL